MNLEDPKIFELNDFKSMNVLEFEDEGEVTNIYYMDNFYKYPDLVFEYICSIEPPLWKIEDQPSLNTINFEDRRHMIDHKGMKNVTNALSNLCGQRVNCGEDYQIVTNFTRFSKTEENNYHDNYWWPHNDSGYNGICYFMDSDNEIGTNLYKPIVKIADTIEHLEPWTPKKYWEIVISLRAKFNRFVMFEGSKYKHGMHIYDDRYFAEHWSEAKYRINQVFFMTNEK